MGFFRKATFVATGGLSGVAGVKANSKKERTAKASEAQVRLMREQQLNTPVQSAAAQRLAGARPLSAGCIRGRNSQRVRQNAGRSEGMLGVSALGGFTFRRRSGREICWMTRAVAIEVGEAPDWRVALDFHSSSGRVAHFALYGKARTNGEREDISVEWVEKALAPAMKNLREAAEEAKRSAVETARVEVAISRTRS